ncbi:MAG: hypothetical protein LBU76_01125, partial [Azoarcus sp.]|nr:hypothetical protein [Azoarcus sp.]
RFLSPGKHRWQWDGYGDDGVLDTRTLKSKALTVRLTATQGGKRQVRELGLGNHAEEVQWADARIDRNSKTIEITVRPSFTDGGTVGDPIPGYAAKTFEELKQMAKRGIERYWTRDGSRPGGIGAPVDTAKGAFSVTVKADVNAEPMADGFALKELLQKRREWGFIRPDDSTSAGTLSQIVHMAHFWIVEYRLSCIEADADFEHTAAHEFGHRIMGAYGGRTYSWTHNQSSTELTQKPLPRTAHPSSGEIDLMKYAEYRTDEQDKWQRAVASEQDVKGLLWLTRVKFR